MKSGCASRLLCRARHTIPLCALLRHPERRLRESKHLARSSARPYIHADLSKTQLANEEPCAAPRDASAPSHRYSDSWFMGMPMKTGRALLVVALMLLASAPARATEPSTTPSPTQEKNSNPSTPESKPADELKGSLDSIKLLTPAIGWAQRSDFDESDEGHKAIYWTADNGAHWRNITPPLTGKSSLDALLFSGYSSWLGGTRTA